jgi:predicted nucleotidyltransferase
MKFRLEITKKLQKYFTTKHEIYSAYLYGSVVEKKQRKDSDIDIALFINEKKIENPLFYRMNLSTDLMELLKGKVDLVILNFANLLLRAQVFEKGQLIYEKDENKRALFQAYSMGLYYDYKRYFEFHSKHLNKKIKEVGIG